MAASQYMRQQSVKKKTFMAALKHNKREIQSERGSNSNIDPLRSHLNYSLSGVRTAKEIAEHAKKLQDEGKVTNHRSDRVEAVEIVFSLPVNFAGDHKAFFLDCLAWVQRHFHAPLLAFDVHLDEAAKHAHCLLLPLVNGDMNGSEILGKRNAIKQRQASFFKEVAGPHGLLPPKEKPKGVHKANLEHAVLMELQRDAAMKSKVWPVIRDDIHANPTAYAERLGISIKKPHQPNKDAASIMIKPQKSY